VLPFKKHRDRLRSSEDLSDDDIVEIKIAPTSQCGPADGVEIPVDVELDPPLLPRPTPPPRSSRRVVSGPPSEPAAPPSIVDPALAPPPIVTRDPVAPSLAPVAISADAEEASEEAHANTVKIPRDAGSSSSTTLRLGRTTIAWAAVWVFFGALASMSAAFLLGYVPGSRDDDTPVVRGAAAQPPPAPADESVIVTHTKRDETKVLTFGDKDALRFEAVSPAAAATANSTATPTATGRATAAATVATATATAKAKTADKSNPLLGPTLDTPAHKPEPKKAEPKLEADAKPKRPAPTPGSVEALMEAQLKAASK
jgi:hypothetical protein